MTTITTGSGLRARLAAIHKQQCAENAAAQATADEALRQRSLALLKELIPRRLGLPLDTGELDETRPSWTTDGLTFLAWSDNYGFNETLVVGRGLCVICGEMIWSYNLLDMEYLALMMSDSYLRHAAGEFSCGPPTAQTAPVPSHGEVLLSAFRDWLLSEGFMIEH